MRAAAQTRVQQGESAEMDAALEHFRKCCRPKIHWYPTLSAEKSGKDGARKSTAKAKML
jgi:hypothetical protein